MLRAAVRVRRLSSASSAAASTHRRRTRMWGAAAVTVVAATVAAQQSPPLDRHAYALDTLLTLRLGALLGTALYDSEAARRREKEAVADDDESPSSNSSRAVDPSAVARDALAAATLLLALVGDAADVSRNELQSRVVELLADAVVDASATGHQQLRALVDRGLVDALLQYLARARPTSERLLQKIVRAVEALVTLAAVDTSGIEEGAGDVGLSSALGISLDTLGAALGHLVDAQALRFTDLLRVGDLLCRAQQQQQAQLSVEAQQRRHFTVSRHGSALRSGDERATDHLALGLGGLYRLLSPEMPSSIKQLPPSVQAELVEVFLSPNGAALLAALPRSNQQLQLQAASFMDDLSDLPVIGAEEYESSTEIGWIDILTSWSGSTLREVRMNAIESLAHLAETERSTCSEVGTASSTATQDHIVQAWLTSMLQHVRHLSGGDEIIAVKQVEEIAKISDGLTPGNEKVLFNPAVVDAGAAALAVLVENHHEELIQQGVVPLMALLSQSRHCSDTYDLKTQSTRVIANLVASSCALLSSYYNSSSDVAELPMDVLLDEETQFGRRNAWKQFVADNFDVERMLQQTSSGKRLLHELRQWSHWEDPMRRSSYFRAAQNMAAYRAFVDTGRLEEDIYCEGVHPIVPYHTATEQRNLESRQESDDSTVEAGAGMPLRPSLDVVFVHGLRGHPFGTWRTDMGKALKGKNDIWPDVLLASDLARSHINARLITLGYEAGMVSWSSPWPSLTLQERGKVMLDALYAANIGCNKRPNEHATPVVFVTHSMGGILVKKMLLLASEQAKAQQQQQANKDNLATSTKGVVFLAVPHFGSDLAKGVRSESVRSLIKAHPAIRDLCADPDGRLVELNDAFRELDIGCMSIGEAKAAPLGLGLSAMVVKAESADPGFGSFYVLTDSDHMTICKAQSADEPHYQAILRFLIERCPGSTAADESQASSML